jgi:D-alanine-D-alanine ligase-like ATP-grasp enzyme
VSVLILHTLPPERADAGRWEWEFDLHETAETIAAELPGAVIVGVHGHPDELTAAIARTGPDVVFNLCEAPLGNPRLEPHAAMLFEWLGVPFTGSRSDTLALCRRKDLTKSVLAAAGVRVPRSAVFPCIVKPLDEDGSAGITLDSVCGNEREAAAAIARASGPVIVEEFVPGREFVVSMWGRGEPECLAIGEIGFSGGVSIVSYEGKWDMESYAYLNAPLVMDRALDSALEGRLLEAARRSWRATGLRGYGTVDLRLDESGTPCVIDVNPNAALNAEGRVYRAVERAGWAWSHFLRQQIAWAR